MRGASIVAFGCLICLSQAGLASSIVVLRFSRPDTSYPTFMDDRTVCLNSSAYKKVLPVGGEIDEYRLHSIPRFTNCMKDKGYALDPHGYRALRYVASRDGSPTDMLPLDD